MIDRKQYDYKSSGVIAINTNLFVIDVSTYTSVAIQCTAMGTAGVVTPSQSMDGDLWVSCTMAPMGGGTASTFSAVGFWMIPVFGKFLRLVLTTATTGGNTSISLYGRDAVSHTSISQIGSSSISSLTPGTSAGNLGKAEDAVHASADTGVFTLGVRTDVLTTPTSGAGDYTAFVCDRFGSQVVRDYRAQGRTYTAASVLTPAAGATDVFEIYGNGTTTVWVHKIVVRVNASSANTMALYLKARSSAGSGGTKTALAGVPHEGSDSAANSIPQLITANPTLGTTVGNLKAEYVNVGTSAASAQSGVEWVFTPGKPLVLAGTAQGIALNLNGITINGLQLSIEICWGEF